MTPRPKKINGAETIGERRWADSPAVADLIATLCDLGLDVDPTPKLGVDWPSPDRKVRDAFHARWTERMQKRCRIDPTQQHPQAGNIERNNRSQAILRETAELYARGLTIAEIAKTMLIRPERVRNALDRQGIKIRKSQDPKTPTTRGRPPLYYADA